MNHSLGPSGPGAVRALGRPQHDLCRRIRGASWAMHDRALPRLRVNHLHGLARPAKLVGLRDHERHVMAIGL